MKIKVHPLFVIVVFLMLAFEQATTVIGYIFAILAHEMAHAKVAKFRGYQMGLITLMPFGGVIEGGLVGINKTDNILIAIAGPACNGVIAILCVALWWLFPTFYNYSLNLCIANVSLAVVNLLPLYPLDGSRVIFSCAKNKLRSIQILKICTMVFGALLFIFGLCVMIFYKFNFTIAVFGIFLIYSAFVKSEQDSYIHIANSFAFNKNYEQGVKKTIYYVDKKCQLFRLLTKLNCNEICEFIVCDGQKNLVTLKESDIEKLCLENKLSDRLETLLNF